MGQFYVLKARYLLLGPLLIAVEGKPLASVLRAVDLYQYDITVAVLN